LAIGLVVIFLKIITRRQEEAESGKEQADFRTIPPLPESIRPAPTVAPVAEEVADSALPVEAEPALSPESESIPSPPAESPEPSPTPDPDNLKRVKGIGPKIEKLLKDNGINTFAQLAKTEVSRLQALLDEVGWNRIADPGTWPEQAKKLAE
jgi:large subunit ribosomal protein L21